MILKAKWENIFDININIEVEVTPRTTTNVKLVLAMKKLQASYNNNANKIVKQAAQEKNTNKNSIFLIDLAIVASDNKPSLDEPQMFKDAWNHPNERISKKKARNHLWEIQKYERASGMAKHA